MNIIRAIKVLRKGMVQADEIFERTSLYYILTRLESLYQNTNTEKLKQIDISDLLQDIKDYQELRNKRVFTDGMFEKETKNDLKIINGWIAICKDSNTAFSNLTDDEAVEYSISAIKIFIFEMERYEEYQKYVKIGQEKNYTYFK